MHSSLARDREDLDDILAQAVRHAQAYLHGLDQRPASAGLAEADVGDTTALPESGPGAAAALDEFHREFEHHLSASPGSRYFGFVTGGATPAALAADWLVGTYDQNAQLNNDTCAPHIEAQAIDMLRQLLDWPVHWSGTCVTGATMANFTGLAIARQWYGHELGHDIAADGLHGLPPPAIFAGSAHSSTLKALAMLGLGRNGLHALPLLPQREALDVSALESALEALDGAPAIVCASAGTVNTVDYDDLAAIARLKQRHRFWLHVDAAFGGIAAASNQHRHLLEGIEAADSVTVDAHKWLNVPYDCAVLFTAHLPLQLQVFQNHSPYLPPPRAVVNNYLHLGPENSRRWRALPLWMTLRAYGRDGHAEIVERNVDAARYFGEVIATEPRLRLAAPVRLNVVCFGLADNDDAKLAVLKRRLDAEGTAYFSASRLGDQAILRAAICNWRTTRADIDHSFAALRDCLDAELQ